MTEAKIENIDTEISVKQEIKSLDEIILVDDNFIIMYDNKKYLINKKYLFISEVLKCAILDDINSKSIDLPTTNITPKAMEFIIECFNHYQGTSGKSPSKPLKDNNMTSFLSDWEISKLSNLNNKDIYDMIMACNYLDIEFMRDKLCALVAFKIRGQPLEKVAELLK
jgi:hypothetical protein